MTQISDERFGPYLGIEEHAFVNLDGNTLRVFVYTSKEDPQGQIDLYDNGVAILDESAGEVLCDGIHSSDEEDIDLFPTPKAFEVFDFLTTTATRDDYAQLLESHPCSRYEGWL